MTESSPSREPAAWPCARLAAHVDEWLDGALPGADATAIAEHLARCPRCAERIAHERRFHASLHRCGGATAAPESLVARVRAALHPDPPTDAVS